MPERNQLIRPLDESLQDYLSDESRLQGTAEWIAMPATEQDIKDILSKATRERIPITISSGRTGITGGAVPSGGLVLSLEKMNRILAVGYDDASSEWYLRTQPGVSMEAIQRALDKKEFPEIGKTASQEEMNDLKRLLKEDIDLFYPPDPTEKTALLGGAAACNASGARTFGFGPTRDFIRRLRIALVSGDIIDLPRGRIIADEKGIMHLPLEDRTMSIPVPGYTMPETKNTAGYYAKPGMDLVDLFIGSEGTLGIITEIEIRLVPRPSHILAVMIYFSCEEDAVKFVRFVRGDEAIDLEVSHLLRAQALEYFDPDAVELLREKHRQQGLGGAIPPIPDHAKAIVYYERLYSDDRITDELCEGLEEALSLTNSSLDDTWAEFDPEGAEKMRDFRHAVPEEVNSMIGRIQAENPGITKLGTDFAVPDEHLETLMNMYRTRLEETGLRFVIFGHIGDNHLHVNIIPHDETDYEKGKNLYEEFAREVVKMGGTVAAEHGIGKLKKNLLHLMLGEHGIEEMIRIKKLLDPQNLLNKENLFGRL